MNRLGKVALAAGAAGVVGIAGAIVLVATAWAEPCEVEVVVTDASPRVGFSTGGTTVTMTGENFAACGIASVSFGDSDGVDLSLTGPGELTVNTPPGTGVVVPRLHFGDDQFADAPSFEYVDAPSVDVMLPPEGPSAGGTAVAIWGHALVRADATSQVSFGDVLVDLSVASATSVEAITPVTPAGIVDVSVVMTLASGEQSATEGRPFTFVPAPTVDSVTPDSGGGGGGEVIVVTGTNFQRGARAFFGRADGSIAPGEDASSRFDGSNVAAAVEFIDENELRVLTPSGSPGVAHVIIVNPDSQFGVSFGGFTYSGQAPSITSLEPATGPSLGGTLLTITGAGFAESATVEFGVGEDRRAATAVDVVSPTEIVATTPPHPPDDDVTVTVTNADRGAAQSNTFDYSSSPVPSLTSLAPAVASSLGGTTITVSGTQFTPGAVVRFGDLADGVEVAAAVLDSSRLTVSSPAHPAGTVEARVVNPDGQQSDVIDFVVEAAEAPTVTSIVPGEGPTAGGTVVTITGTGFAPGAEVRVGDRSLLAQGDALQGILPLVRNSTTIVGITQAGVGGARDVTVTNPDRATATGVGAFTYTGPPLAALTSIVPAVGTSIGGQHVELIGTNFATGSHVTFGNADCSTTITPLCNPVATDVVVTPTSITAVTPPGLFGFQNVTVVGPDGTLAGLRYGFDFGHGAAPPTIDTIDPSTTRTGAAVMFNGSNFAPDAQALIGSQRLTGVVEEDADGDSVSLPIVRDANTIVGLVPRQRGGTFPVAVSNSDGQGVIVADAFSYPVDTTAPSTIASATTGTPRAQHPFGADSWARGPVTVTLTATDDAGGSGVDSITYSSTGAQTISSTDARAAMASFVLTAEGRSTVTFGATDIAGTLEAPSSEIVAIDSVRPSITPSTTFVPGTQTNHDVEVDFECTDTADGSGLQNAPMTAVSTSTITVGTANPLTVTFTEPGIGQSVSVTCTDIAGNETTRSFGGINISREGPTLIATATTADGRTYQPGTWTNLNVVVTFVCRAPATIGPLGSPQIASVTPPQIISTSVTDATVSGHCTDSAGNIVDASLSGIRIDKTRPIVTVEATTGGSPYIAGTWTNRPVLLTFTCSDDGADQSGVDLVSPPVEIDANGTTAGGTGGCTDGAGNRADPAVFLGPVLIDTTAPSCSVIVMPNPIGPANSKVVAVRATVLSDDELSDVADVRLISVTSSQPASASSDISGFQLGTADLTGSLRATRGRVYVVTYAVSDLAGNQSTQCAASVIVN